MSRTRELLKFAWLIAAAVAVTVVFLSIVDLPSTSLAQEPQSIIPATQPAPVVPAQPVIELGNAFAEVAEAVKPAVVYIVAEQRERQAQRSQPESPFERFFDPPQGPQRRPRSGSGSGFIISPDGYIMTNNHVVSDFDRFFVTLESGKTHPATVVGGDPFTDVAVLKIEGEDFPTASLGDSDPLRVGEWVLAVGNPLGLTFTVTAGIVSARARGNLGLLPLPWNIADFIQTDAAINPGNSGGPLVNIQGQVVGINSAIASQTGTYVGYGFAIPINLARHIADQLISEGKVTRAALGVRIQPPTPEDVALVGLDDIYGVVLNGFAGDDSPAKNAGLQIGDLIVEVDGQRVEYVAQLQQMVGFKKPGDRVKVAVLREGGERHTYTVRLIRARTAPDEPQVALTGPERDDEESFAAKLGVSVEPLTSQLVSQLGGRNAGLVVTYVDPDGPSRGKLRSANNRARGLDIITHVNDQPIHSMADLEDALRGVRSGSIVSLLVTGVSPDAQGQPVVTPRVVRVRAE